MNQITFQNKTYFPSKVVCVGRNYVEHIQELDNEIPSEPVIFIKPNSAISQTLCLHHTDSIHYEAEISLLIEAGSFVGVAIGLDLTKRDIQSTLKQKGLPWERAKAFNQSALFSNFVPIVEPISQLTLELYINGKITQQGSYALMLNKPDALLANLQDFLTVEDGDILMTGTPKGVGEVRLNDVFVGKILNDNKLLVEHTWVARNK